MLKRLHGIDCRMVDPVCHTADQIMSTAQASEHDECDAAKLFARAKGGSASLAVECRPRTLGISWSSHVEALNTMRLP